MINILKSTNTLNSDSGFAVTQEKRDQINHELINKEIRIIDINVVVNQAAALKKERD
jgi:hypothetical protein